MNPELVHTIGMSLSSARFHLADPALIEEHNRKNAELQEPDKYLDRLGNENEKFGEAAKRNPETFRNIALIAGSLTQMMSPADLERSVLQKIYAGELIAAGFALPRSHDSKPVFLNRDVWAGKIRWGKSEVVGNGLHYVGICLARKTEIEKQAVLRLSQPSTKKKGIGRPGVAQEIGAAMRELDELGLIDFEKPRAQCYPLAREHLAKQYPDNSEKYQNLSDKTLERHTAPYFRERKA